MAGPFTENDAPQPAPAAPAATPQQTLATAQNSDRSSLAPQPTPTSSIAPQPTANVDTPGQNSQTWGDRVYHGVLSALGGASDVSLARDPQTGKMVATQVRSGPGQQWKRIIAGAVSGYAGAAATGAHGPGSTSAKIGAGFNSGREMVQKQQQGKQQQADDDFEAQQKAATSSAQNALLSHQIAKSSFELSRDQVKGAESDLTRENTFSQVIGEGGAGSQDLGVFSTFDAVIKAFKENPELHDHQAGGRLIAIPHVNEKGIVDGVHAALVSPDWLNSKINQDLPISVRNYKDGKLEESTFTIPAGSLTGDQYSKLVMSQSKESLDAAEKAKRDELQGSRDRAANAASYASAEHSRAETKKIATETGADDATIDQIGKGQINVGRMAYLLARNPDLVNQVTRKYPDFDNSKVESYASTYKDFTEGKTSVALNAGATALKHLRELYELNTNASHVPHSPAWTAYQNKADTVSTELARFYGDSTIPAIASIKKTLTSTLLGNRASAIKTQAGSMGDKLDSFEQTWRNAAPSKAYEAPMPEIDNNARHSRAVLDPNYMERLASQLPEQATSALSQHKGQPVTFANGQTWQLVNGKPVWVR